MSSSDRHETLKSLAYALWTARGKPIGTPEVDWIQAERMLNAEYSERGDASPEIVDHSLRRSDAYMDSGIEKVPLLPESEVVSRAAPNPDRGRGKVTLKKVR